MFCKHNWKLLDKTILQSAFEQLSEKNNLSGFTGYVSFEKKIVYIFSCEKCGKINKKSESNG